MIITLPDNVELETYDSGYTPEQIEESIGKGPIVQNGTWWVWSVADSAYQDTGVEATSIPSNPNILLNADFRRPVNRQGKLEYVGSGYAIDRWKLNISSGGSASVSLNSDGITLTCVSGSSAFRQGLERLPAGAYTVSVLTTTHGLISGTLVWDGNTAVSTPTVDGVYIRLQMYNENPHFTVQVSSGASAKLQAAKLELGDKQTLAHQDEEGNWVLNDPPNYDLQYLLTSLYSPTTGEWVGIQHSNPNLLDNWYFIGGGSQQGGGQFPINQRGLTEYTGLKAQYFIDRWKTHSSLGVGDTYTLTQEGLKVQCASGYAAGNNAWIFKQVFENPEELSGKTVTFSFLYDLPDGVINLRGIINVIGDGGEKGFYTPENAAVAEGGLLQVTATLPQNLTRLWIVFMVNSAENTQFIIKAAKLELGPVQTLACESAGGGWQLIDPAPNFADELMRCRYYYRSAHEYIVCGASTGNGVYVQFPFSMRTNATIIGTELGGLYINGENYDVGAVSAAEIFGDSMRVLLSPKAGLSFPNKHVAAWRKNSIALSADL